MIVIDASTALAWAFDEEDFVGRFAAQFASERLLASPIWRLEVVNAILRNERQRLITPEQGNELQMVHRTIFGRNVPNCSTCVIESVFSLLVWADQKQIELAQLADDEQKPKRKRK